MTIHDMDEGTTRNKFLLQGHSLVQLEWFFTVESWEKANNRAIWQQRLDCHYDCSHMDRMLLRVWSRRCGHRSWYIVNFLLLRPPAQTPSKVVYIQIWSQISFWVMNNTYIQYISDRYKSHITTFHTAVSVYIHGQEWCTQQIDIFMRWCQPLSARFHQEFSNSQGSKDDGASWTAIIWSDRSLQVPLFWDSQTKSWHYFNWPQTW